MEQARAGPSSLRSVKLPDLGRHGMVHVDLLRETAEALKPRRNELASGNAHDALVRGEGGSGHALTFLALE